MDFERYVHAQCALLGLTLTEAQLPGVVRYLQLAASVAPRVMDFALTPADESGNVFIPVVPVRPSETEAPAP